MFKRKSILLWIAGFLAVGLVVFAGLEFKRSSGLYALAKMGFPVTPEAMLKYYDKVPDDENAWVLLEGLREKIQIPEELLPNLPIVGDSEWGCGDNGSMPQEVRGASEAVLALNADLLETIHEAVRRPYMRIPGTVTEEGYLSFDKYGDAAMREFARLIMLQGQLALETKDYVLATKDFVSGMHLARLEGQQTGFIAPLVQYAILSMPLAMVPSLPQANPASDELLSDLFKSLHEQEMTLNPSKIFALDLADNTLGLEENLTADSYNLNDFFQNLVLIEEKWVEITRYLVIPYENFYNRYIFVFLRYDFLNEVFTKELSTQLQCSNACAAAHDQFSYLPVTPDMSFMPASDLRLMDSSFFHLSNLRFWQMVVALKRFNLKYGHFPSKLAELQPEFFDALPVVPVEETEWEYTANAEGCNLHYVINYYRYEDLDITLLNR